jgi:exodeoxyribonuclease V alpha subunit
MAQLQEITAVFISEQQRWDQTIIGSAQMIVVSEEGQDQHSGKVPIKIKGTADEGELEYLLTYRFYGRWKKYTNKRTGVSEDQFEFQTFVRAQPHGMQGVVRYLQNAPHVGSATARKLWEGFQSDAVRVLREQPEVAVARVGGSHFTIEKAREAAAFLQEEAALESCTLDLMDLLTGRGFPKSVARQAIRAWGNRAAEVLRRNPYLLMKFRGCGFLRTDQMYLDLGGEPGRLKRQALCAWHSLASNSDGHTWFPVAVVERGLREKVGGAAISEFAALKLAKRGRMIDTRRDEHDRLWVSERTASLAEERIAERLAQAATEPCKWPSVASCEVLSEHQREHASEALAGVVCHLGGGPGTGKTFTAAQIVKLIQSSGLGGSIAVAAPTGKAAVRITEAMRSYGINLQAQTIHSLLGVETNSDGGGWTFRHNANCPLPHRWLIVDESSMIDVPLMDHLLAARATGTHLLLVGDVHQLPPVGHGAPLRDFIAANVPHAILTEIRRNSGRIVSQCHSIREGQEIRTSMRVDLDVDDPENLYLVQASNADQQMEKILKAIALQREEGLDPVWDVQVLVAVNEKSGVSRKALNQVLQSELMGKSRSGLVTKSSFNGAESTPNGNPFRTGDKIVNTQNGFFPECQPDGSLGDDAKVFIANGELAEVLHAESGFTIARTRPGEVCVKIPRGQKNETEGDSGCSWDLGYALSVHKSQGSEWPVVIVVLDDYAGARMVTSREWIYTAISRAKRLCLLVGKLATAHAMVRRVALKNRKTFLVERIEEQRRLLTCQADMQTAELELEQRPNVEPEKDSQTIDHLSALSL